MLVASQWPTIPAPASPQNDGGYFPGQLLCGGRAARELSVGRRVTGKPGQTTIETYFQDAPSSCMACHQSLSNALGRGFVGMLGSFR